MIAARAAKQGKTRTIGAIRRAAPARRLDFRLRYLLVKREEADCAKVILNCCGAQLFRTLDCETASLRPPNDFTLSSRRHEALRPPLTRVF